jgi:hypothetical protein
MRRTAEEIRQAGLEALLERLGRAGMIQFLQQFETGKGDYSRERHAWVDRMSLADLRALLRPAKPKGRRRPK